MIRVSKTIFSLLIGILFISAIINIVFLRYSYDQNVVVKVVDGDSIDLKDGRRIRLLGLDAPEKNKCYSNEAKERLTSLTLGERVVLKDIVRDDYGRILANVFVGDILVNKTAVSEGLARFVYVRSPYYDDLKNEQAKAKANKLGIYSPLCRSISKEADCEIKGNIREGRKIYHLPNCSNYKDVIIDESFGDRWFCSEDEAVKEGFIKATGCRG